MEFVRKRSIRVKIGDYLSRVTLKFDERPWKKIGNLFYATLNFVHNIKSIGEFKLDLQTENAQLGSKLVIFMLRVILKLYGWPWQMIGHLFYTTSSLIPNPSVNSNWSDSPETLNSG